MTRPTPAVPRTVHTVHTTATAAAASSEALAAPGAGKRRSYLLVQNVGTEAAWIKLDGTACTAAAPCILLAAGASFGGTAHVPQGGITCIRGGAGNVALSVVYEELDR